MEVRIMSINLDELYESPEQRAGVETTIQKFLQTYETYISPAEGADELLKYLQKSDFFTAPASTQFHGSHPGGLVLHSVNVYERLCGLVNLEQSLNDDPKVQAIAVESIAKVAFLHDLCKIDVYKPGTRNVKNEETGAWEKVPFYKYEDSLPFGHGEKSQYIAGNFIRLSRSESMAIRWHMGPYDAYVKGDPHGAATLSKAFEMFPLALLLHQADQTATHIDECKP